MPNIGPRDPWQELAALDEAMAETRRRSGPIREDVERLGHEASRALEWLAAALGRSQQRPRRDSNAA